MPVRWRCRDDAHVFCSCSWTAEGTVYTARILNQEDLNRQLVKSASCSVTIPQYELTIPPSRGQLTTVEGLIRDIAADLSTDQPLRKYQDENAYTKIQSIIDSIKAVLNDDEGGDEEPNGPKEPNHTFAPFTVQLDDPAGNSFIEFLGSTADPKWNIRTYARTHAQNVALGIAAPDDADAESDPNAIKKMKEAVDRAVIEQSAGDVKDDEILVFPGLCSSCSRPLDTLMKKVNIPYFKVGGHGDHFRYRLQTYVLKDIFIMSTNCDACGYRDNEVKSGSAISEKGKKIILKVEDRDDLSRDILKVRWEGFSMEVYQFRCRAKPVGFRYQRSTWYYRPERSVEGSRRWKGS
jgi:zinc finger protein